MKCTGIYASATGCLLRRIFFCSVRVDNILCSKIFISKTFHLIINSGSMRQGGRTFLADQKKGGETGN